MAKRRDKSVLHRLAEKPRVVTPFEVPAIIYAVIKERKEDKQRKKDEAVLEKNKNMIMGELEGYRRPSGEKADPNTFTLEEMYAVENPSYPLTKEQKTRIYGDPNATSRLKSGGKIKKTKVKKTKAHRGDGIAKRGRTKGRII